MEVPASWVPRGVSRADGVVVAAGPVGAQQAAGGQSRVRACASGASGLPGTALLTADT